MNAAGAWRTAWRLALREARGGLRGFRVFLACLALGVFAIAAVGSMAASIVAGLEQNARAILGGDIEVRQTAQDLSADAREWLAQNSEAVSLSREMRAMARVPAPESGRTIVELKAISGPYPLYGATVLDPPMALDAALGERGGRHGVVAEPELLSRLGVAVGDTLAIGDATFELRAEIVQEPDRVANTFSLGPRVMADAAGFAASGLQREGSLLRFKYRVRLAPGTDYEAWTEAFRAAFPDGAWRVRNAAEAQPSIRRFIDRLAVFLTLAGVTALTVGGIGVGIAVQAYLAGKTETIATLKCLGARGGLIFRIYLLQIGMLAALGIAAGLVLGALTPFVALALYADVLPVPTEAGVHPMPLALAAAFGVLTALAFTVWPLARAREVPPASLFRDMVSARRRWPRRPYLVLTALAAAALALLAVFGTGRPEIAQWLVLGILGALAGFRAAAGGIVALVKRLPRARRATLRLALANMVRPGAPSASIVVSLGVGLTVLVATALVQGNIARQVAERIPSVAPSFFFIDVQPQQAAAFDETVRSTPGFLAMERVPNLRGRIVAIDGTPLDEADIPPGMNWVGRAEFGITYAAELPEQSEIVAGEWWPADYDGPPLVSVEREMIDELGLAVGDTLTFNILGRNITATIASLREIDWSDFGINFVMTFAPGTLEAAPQTHLATASFAPDAEAAAYERVTSRFANVSTVRVRDVIETASELLGRIATAAQGTAAITILAGVLVLAGAVAAGHRRRVYEAVVLKVLGATRADILKAYVLEFLILGAITGVVAAGLGTLAAWLVVTRAMEASWLFLPLSTVATALAGIAIVTGLGYAGTWVALSQRPAPVLRAG